MRENRADTTRAVVLALLLHVALVALLLFGMLFSRPPAQVSAAGSPISAEVIDPNALSRATLRALAQDVEPLPDPLPEPLPEPLPDLPAETAPPPQPLPSPRPEDSPVEPQPQAQQPLPVPDTVDQDAARRDAIARETALREQEERRRQEQIDLTERERQKEAEERRRLSEMEAQRQKQLADIRRQREQAEQERRRLEQQQQQLAERRAQQASQQAASNASPPPGNNGSSDDLRAKYAAALQEAILRNWTRPDTVPLGQRCRIVIRQIPGGQVISAVVDPSCPYDELGRRSVEAAVLRAQPLPYAGFESAFQRTVTLNFQAQDR